MLIRLYQLRRLKYNSFWLALFAYSLLMALQTTLGRVPLDFMYVEKPRYTTFVSMMLVSTVVMFADIFRFSNYNFDRTLFRLYAVAVIALAAVMTWDGWRNGAIFRQQRLEYRDIVYRHQEASYEEIKTMCRWCDSTFVPMVRSDAAFLEQHRYNLFAEKQLSK